MNNIYVLIVKYTLLFIITFFIINAITKINKVETSLICAIIIVCIFSLDKLSPITRIDHMANAVNFDLDNEIKNVELDVDSKLKKVKQIQELQKQINELEIGGKTTLMKDKITSDAVNKEETVVVSKQQEKEEYIQSRTIDQKEDTSDQTDPHVKKLLNLYFNLLTNSGLLTEEEVYSLTNKIDSGLFTPREVITKLESLLNKSKMGKGGYNDWYTELQKSTLSRGQTEPVGKYDDTFTNKFEHGYSYLDTDKWRVPMPRPPVCVTNQKCEVCPSATEGYPLNLKEWDSSRYVSKSETNNH
jgi:hypothetical protein